MSNSKQNHTPGPWIISDTGFITTTDDVLIADTYTLELQTKQDRTANAQLIAAAPELLTALKDLVKYLKYSEPEDVASLELAKQAIAKAEGHDND